MNIGLFTETYYPEVNGVAMSVYMLKTELERLGHNVYVFTTTTPGAPENEHHVYRVPSIPCILITERRVGLFYQRKFAAMIKKLDLDIIHTHTEFSLGIFGRIMAKELRIPIVHTYHTIYEDYTHYLTHFKILDKRAKSFVKVFSKMCCNTVKRVIVPTDKVKELLERYCVKKEISVVPTGIDLNKFNPDLVSMEQIERLKQRYGILPNDKIILYIGRISKEKNIQELLRAMPEYLGSRTDCKFLIVGGGPYLSCLKELAEQLGITDRVIFTGEQPWDDIAAYYQLGDVFVSASTSETQGLTYIEAMASGLPVVARRDPCLKDIMIEGRNGYTFTCREELIESLDIVLYDNDNVDYRGNSISISEQFSTKEFAKSIETVYESVIMDQSEMIEL